MLDPEYLLRVSDGAEDIAEQLHNVIIKEVVERIMIRLGRGDEYVLTPRDKWQLEVLEDAGYILTDLQEEIAKKIKMQRSEIREAFEDADVKNRSYDDAIYTAAGLPISKRSPQMIRIMQRMYEATLGEWSNYCRTTANAAQRLFIRECDKAYNLVLSGTMGYTEAVKRAVETIAGDGVVLTYPSGKTDTIETATLRAVRTGVSQTAAQITLQRAQENSVDLVVTSSHLGARPTHEPWQGKVFHVDFGNNPGDGEYPDFVKATGYGTVEGLCGANCRHSFYPYIEGVSHNPFEEFDSEENKKRYEAEQKQRALERAIRKSKRKCEGLKTAVDNADDVTRPAMQEAYGKAAAKLRQQNAEYKQFCEDNGLKTRQDRVSIAGWDRKQAAQARAAAGKIQKTPQVTGKNPLDGIAFNWGSIPKENAESYERTLRILSEKYPLKNQPLEMCEDFRVLYGYDLDEDYVDLMDEHPEHDGTIAEYLPFSKHGRGILVYNPDASVTPINEAFSVLHSIRERTPWTSAKDSFYNVATGTEADMIHEYGHAIAYDKEFYRGQSRYAEIEKIFNDYTRDEIGKQLSKYAATQPGEMFAEAFLQSFDDEEHQSEICKRIMELISQ